MVILTVLHNLGLGSLFPGTLSKKAFLFSKSAVFQALCCTERAQITRWVSLGSVPTYRQQLMLFVTNYSLCF